MARVPTEKHIRAAALMLDGLPMGEALRKAGYALSTSRNPGALLRTSSPLLRALNMETARRQAKIVPRPKRQWDKYTRRSVGVSVERYRGVESNRAARYIFGMEQKAKRIAAGWRSPLCSRCRCRLEGHDRWCPNCERVDN